MGKQDCVGLKSYIAICPTPNPNNENVDQRDLLLYANGLQHRFVAMVTRTYHQVSQNVLKGIRSEACAFNLCVQLQLHNKK